MKKINSTHFLKNLVRFGLIHWIVFCWIFVKLWNILNGLLSILNSKHIKCTGLFMTYYLSVFIYTDRFGLNQNFKTLNQNYISFFGL